MKWAPRARSAADERLSSQAKTDQKGRHQASAERMCPGFNGEAYFFGGL
jgi:hypothetical protein